ncbi:TonB family protein [Allochromatium palmeri]|uniref:Protein TonB n=1 Tax=Allochromatium palmeri TaxID=231048 RepID=A0A6N8EAQ9_9GAMM|nr:TonB family protein [Allochromatium palmeri]
MHIVQVMCRHCPWLALLLSAVLHAAVAAVFWHADLPRVAESSRPVVAFELVPVREDSDTSAETSSDPANAPTQPAPPTVPAAVPAPAPIVPNTQDDTQRPTKEQAPPAPKTLPKPPPKPKPKPKLKPDVAPKARSPDRVTRTTTPSQTRASQDSPKRSEQATDHSSRRTNAASPALSASTQEPKATPASRINAERAYLSALQRAIARHQRYPAGARRHGKTGVAMLSFVIQTDGRLGQIQLAQSSGHAALDQAALQALARLGRFDPIPRSIGRTSWALRVPVRFNLE